MGYALRFTVNWSDVVVMLPIASCVIVGAKFALEVLEFLPAAAASSVCCYGISPCNRQVNEPANSPWTTVNQLLLGGRAPTNRLEEGPATFLISRRRSSSSTCCCDPSSLPPWFYGIPEDAMQTMLEHRNPAPPRSL